MTNRCWSSQSSAAISAVASVCSALILAGGLAYAYLQLEESRDQKRKQLAIKALECCADKDYLLRLNSLRKIHEILTEIEENRRIKYPSERMQFSDDDCQAALTVVYGSPDAFLLEQDIMQIVSPIVKANTLVKLLDKDRELVVRTLSPDLRSAQKFLFKINRCAPRMQDKVASANTAVNELIPWEINNRTGR
ncbi:MAG: hypothetical protein V1797_05685 [Pseudomonadota bacterium]